MNNRGGLNTIKVVAKENHKRVLINWKRKCVRAAVGVSAAFVYGPALHKASGCATKTAVREAAGRHKVSPKIRQMK
jgi:hypothetical protein